MSCAGRIRRPSLRPCGAPRISGLTRPPTSWRTRSACLLLRDTDVLAGYLGPEAAGGPDAWLGHPYMGEKFRRWRASVVARARFVDDIVSERVDRGHHQYVSLGAGLDSFAFRRTSLVRKLRIFEVDEPGTQAWKRRRLHELDMAPPETLSFVPVDFERQSDEGDRQGRIRPEAAGRRVLPWRHAVPQCRRHSGDAARCRSARSRGRGLCVTSRFQLTSSSRTSERCAPKRRRARRPGATRGAVSSRSMRSARSLVKRALRR